MIRGKQQKQKEKNKMKEAVNYSVKDFQELLTLAMTGNREAASEILARQEAARVEIEVLRVRASSKARAPRAEKTPIDLARDNAYFRTALLCKEFGQENVTLQTLTLASAYLEQGLSQGNLRQALNRVSQMLKAQKTEETVFPEWIVTAAGEIPIIDENLKLEEEEEKVAEIKAIIQKYSQTPATEQPENSETANTPTPTAKSAKGSKK